MLGTKHAICGCGDCEAVAKEALQITTQLLGNDKCPSYILALASMLTQFGNQAAVRSLEGPRPLDGLLAAIVMPALAEQAGRLLDSANNQVYNYLNEEDGPLEGYVDTIRKAVVEYYNRKPAKGH